MQTYVAEVHYDDEDGYPCEAEFSVGAWDEGRARVLVADKAEREGLTGFVIASLEVAA